MTRSTGSEIRVAVWFTAAFLFGGFVHVVLDVPDLTSCITQIYYSSLTLAWGMTVSARIIDKRVRGLMLLMVSLIFSQYFLQMCRYRIFETFDTACRYFWYGYYFSILLVPVVFLFIVLHLNLREDERPDRHWLLTLIPSAVFLLLVLTNDFHQLIFSFVVDGSGRFGTYTHTPLYFIMYGWVILVFLFALFLAIRKCRIPRIRKKLWLPVYFSCFGIFVLLTLVDEPKIAGVNVWLLVESLAMVTIGICESCIQLGLIPANSSYKTLFRLSDKPVIVSDASGARVFTSPVAEEMFSRNDETVQISTSPISGGSVSWAVDLTDMMTLNREILKVTEEIQSRNDYLRTENSLREEQSKTAARSELYNRITGIVTPQLNAIEILLRQAQGEKTPETDAILARIALLDTYIKRRSNMELLRSDLKRFPTKELSSAIRESCSSLSLCGVNAMLHVTPTCELSADTQIKLYEAFESITEACLGSLRHLLVNVICKDGNAVMRLTLNASGLEAPDLRDVLPAAEGTVSLETDDDELLITVTVPEGGASV